MPPLQPPVSNLSCNATHGSVSSGLDLQDKQPPHVGAFFHSPVGIPPPPPSQPTSPLATGGVDVRTAPATELSPQMVDMLINTFQKAMTVTSPFGQPPIADAKGFLPQSQQLQGQQLHDYRMGQLRTSAVVSRLTSNSTAADSSPPNASSTSYGSYGVPGFSWGQSPQCGGVTGGSTNVRAPSTQPIQQLLPAATAVGAAATATGAIWNNGVDPHDVMSLLIQGLDAGRFAAPSRAISPPMDSVLPQPPQFSVISLLHGGPLQVCVIGSGNWGSAVARVVALNTRNSHLFWDTVHIWTYEEVLNNGKKISEVINKEHENPKYLPGVELPTNLVAVTDLIECARTADLLCFVIPHQFVQRICDQLQGHLKPSARAVTFVKGLAIKAGIPRLYSDVIAEKLHISCDAVSGAYVAKDLSADQFCESTVGYTDPEMASIWQQLFDRPCFRIYAVPDPAGVQVCGAIKNLVALAAGFCDGLNASTNSKSAIIRIGMAEMKLFATLFFDGVLEDTFNESAGLADMVTTCFGGSRSLKCAAEFVAHEGQKSWADVEAEVLKGQRLQGRLACADVHAVLERFGVIDLFPLFHQCYEIAFNLAPPSTLLEVFMTRPIAHVRSVNDCHEVKVPGYLRDFKQTVALTILKATQPGALCKFY